MFRCLVAGLMPVIWVGSAWAGSVWAQAPPVVTEAQFLESLADSHPAVLSKSESLAVARAQVVAASVLRNPVFGAAREDPDGPTAETDWTISWQLPHPDRNRVLEARRGGAQAAEERLALDLLSLRLELKDVYAQWAIASARRWKLEGQVERLQSLAEREAARARSGESSGLEAQRLLLAAETLRGSLTLLEAEVEEARARARGWQPDLPSDAVPELPEVPPPTVLGVPLLEDSLSLRAAAADLRAATLEREAASRVLRSPEISLGWQRQEAGDASVSGATYGLAWSVPLFDRKQSQKAMTEARVAGARSRLELVRRELTAARPAALESYRKLTAALDSAEATLEGNAKMLLGVEAAFRQGEASLTDLLATLRSATDAEMAKLDLYEATLAAQRRLEALSGPHQIARDPSSSTISQEQLP